MNKKSSNTLLMLLLVVTLMSSCSVAKHPADSNQTSEAATEWYNKQEWLNGLSLTPHNSINKEEFFKEYSKHKVWWDKAFSFMKNTDLANSKPGNYPIDGNNVYAIITEVPLKNIDSSRWEVHKNYNDIHYVITGKAKIGIGSLASATEIVPYDSAKDIGFFKSEGTFYTADPGTFFIASPKDIHRPDLELNGKGRIKKLLIKIRA
jgi:biofilm protein TabA